MPPVFAVKLSILKLAQRFLKLFSDSSNIPHYSHTLKDKFNEWNVSVIKYANIFQKTFQIHSWQLFDRA